MQGSSRLQGLGANIRKAEYEKLQSYSFSNIDHFRVSSLVTRLTSDVIFCQDISEEELSNMCATLEKIEKNLNKAIKKQDETA